MLIVDAHQDLAWNMLVFGRDYTRSALETRRLEMQSNTPERNGDTLLGWPEYQRGRVALVFASLFVTPLRKRIDAWEALVYKDTAEARLRYRQQMEIYQRLVDRHPTRFRLVSSRAGLEALLSAWQMEGGEAGHPVGLVVTIEGAECVEHPEELEEWWSLGVRLIGPAWAGTRFCGGTREPGPLTKEGRLLLEGMAEHGFILDISHMDEQAVREALDIYPGVVAASHANAQALVGESDSNRHLSDRVLRGLIERDGVVGIVPFNPFLKAGWAKGDRREAVTLQQVVAQIDYVCQLAGDPYHVGIGSDFDGGYGVQSVPLEIDTIADLQKLGPILHEKGYTWEHIAAVLGGNWISLLRRGLPND